MSDYNGWSNRATWNVNLWLTCDYVAYKRFTRNHFSSATKLATAIKALAYELWPDGMTPDNIPLAEVNWHEIAESWLAD